MCYCERALEDELLRTSARIEEALAGDTTFDVGLPCLCRGMTSVAISFEAGRSEACGTRSVCNSMDDDLLEYVSATRWTDISTTHGISILQ